MPKSRFLVSLIGLAAISVCVAVVTIASAIWLGGNELQAQQILMNAGALVVMSQDGKHVSTVNLSTVQDPAKLHELLELIANLHNLQALDLNNTTIKNSDLAILASTTSLVSLSLQTTNIDDEGLRHLANHTGLESLHLNQTAITDEGLKNLALLKRLKVLDLSGTRVNKDLSPLAQLSSLEWLVLGDLVLADTALAALENSTNLKRLTLRGSKYADSAAKQLSAKHPRMRIDE